jgi:rhodanese-related sulfurtransferase
MKQASEAETAAKEIPDDRITIHELKRKMDRKEAMVIIDARAGNAYIGSSVKIKDSIHITLDELQSRMSKLPKNKEIITYCT